MEALIAADGIGIVIGPISVIAFACIGCCFIFSRRAERGSLRTAGQGKELYGSAEDDADLLDGDADSLMDDDDELLDDLDDGELVEPVAKVGDGELLLGGGGAESSDDEKEAEGAQHQFLE